ncbi:histidine kinase [Anopheles sinensis]|uniref:Histidine kinase n=1 Tax=Anopheles sinensis TaxID=74873 RepID=A0A084VGQ9_ANOSI|nr:histidine kinase [Anopheles sinensis]
MLLGRFQSPCSCVSLTISALSYNTLFLSFSSSVLNCSASEVSQTRYALTLCFRGSVLSSPFSEVLLSSLSAFLCFCGSVLSSPLSEVLLSSLSAFLCFCGSRLYTEKRALEDFGGELVAAHQIQRL